MNTTIQNNSLDCIGNTPLVKLNKVVPERSANVYLKLEYFNPTGSKKDRMALSMIEGAEQKGHLKKGMTVVEFSGGSTGAGLAFVCGVKGYRFRLISSDAFGKEKLDMMAALGAELEIIKSRTGKITKEVVRAMVDRAAEIAAEPNTFFTNQLENTDVIKGFEGLGEEIIRHLDGKTIDAVCDTVGTAGTLSGIAKAFSKSSHKPLIVALEPASSPVLTTGKSGAHTVEGVGLGFVPHFLKNKNYDKALAIEESEARKMAKRLAREEGLFCGTSTGMNVVGALEIAKSLDSSKNVVVVACDTGLKYLSEGLYL